MSARYPIFGKQESTSGVCKQQQVIVDFFEFLALSLSVKRIWSYEIQTKIYTTKKSGLYLVFMMTSPVVMH